MAQLSQGLRRVPLARQKSDPQTLQLEGWMPDRPDLGNPGALVARNVTPLEEKTWGPFRQQETLSDNSLDSACRGLAITTDAGGDPFLYAGSLSKLYQYVGGTFSDISQAGDYTVPSEGRWQFAVYGGLIIATNFADPVQSRLIGDPVALFADHITSTNKPQARYIATLRDFLVLGYTNDATDGLRPNRIWWSAINDSQDFDPDATTQSDFNDFKDGGAVTGVVGGAEYGVIFQEARINRMTYVGPPVIFDLDAVDRQRGCRYPYSLIQHGRLVFYYSDEGFMVFDGTTSQAIGSMKVDRYVAEFVTQNEAFKIVSTKDPILNLAIWGFPIGGSETALRLLIYNWISGEWTEADCDFEEMSIILSDSVLVDDGTWPIDTDPRGLLLVDSAQWRGGNILIGGVDSNHNLVSTSGQTRRATVQSGEFQFAPGARSIIRSVQPIVDAAAECRILTRDRQEDDPTTIPSAGSPAVVKNDYERCDFRGLSPKARYHRLQMEIPAGLEWEHAQGFRLWAQPLGDR